MPGADQANSTPALGERHQQQSAGEGMAHEDLASLNGGMIWVGMDLSEEILEDSYSLLESHAVPLELRYSLLRIPLECRDGHDNGKVSPQIGASGPRPPDTALSCGAPPPTLHAAVSFILLGRSHFAGPRWRDPPFLGGNVGDGLGERPPVTPKILHGVLPLAEELVRR